VYNREEEILEQYNFEVKNTAKGRGALICDTKKGMLQLKEFRGSTERADFLYKLLEFLYQQGFLAERILPVNEEQILARDEIEEISYFVKSHFSGKECDVRNREDILSAVKKLAGLHNLTACYDGEIPAFLQKEKDALLREYEKHNRELNKVRNYIRNKRRKNDFELLFMRVYDAYMNQAKEVTEQLKQQLESLDEAEKQQMWGICHGAYNQHNVLFCRGEWVILNFEQMGVDVYVQDLSNFMRKILEKNNWNTGLGIEMITAYDGIRKLLPEELRQVYLCLAYPHKYWKIANHYYNSRKAWISGRDIEKLQKIIEQEEQRRQFLRMLFHFTSQK